MKSPTSRAWSGEVLPEWEIDFARISWQSMQVHNGGFEQWIGNTGREGARETLIALRRFGAGSVAELTKDVLDLTRFESWDEKDSFYNYLEGTIEGWWEILKPLNGRSN